MLFLTQTVVQRHYSSLRCRSSNSVNSCLDIDESAKYGMDYSVYVTMNSAPTQPSSSLPHYLFILPIDSAETAVPSSAAFPVGMAHASICACVCSVMVS